MNSAAGNGTSLLRRSVFLRLGTLRVAPYLAEPIGLLGREPMSPEATQKRADLRVPNDRFLKDFAWHTRLVRQFSESPSVQVRAPEGEGHGEHLIVTRRRDELCLDPAQVGEVEAR